MIAGQAIRTFSISSLLVLCSISALAQSQTTGRIAGTIKDVNGAVIAGAEVTVKSLFTDEERVVATDAQGHYGVTLLSPGAYRVNVMANGFKRTEIESVRVVITETITIIISLEVGDVSEQVIINASGPLLQLGGPQLGGVVDSRAGRGLPLPRRNFLK